MTKLGLTIAAAGIGVALSAMPTAATAQSSGDKVSEIIVYGTDPCPRSTDDDIVVCARKPESDRYRIPERLRSGGSPQARQAWVNNARALETVGSTGINSCSPVGPAGFTGCLSQVIRQARNERQEAVEQGTAPEQ